MRDRYSILYNEFWKANIPMNQSTIETKGLKKNSNLFEFGTYLINFLVFGLRNGNLELSLSSGLISFD